MCCFLKIFNYLHRLQTQLDTVKRLLQVLVCTDATQTLKVFLHFQFNSHHFFQITTLSFLVCQHASAFGSWPVILGLSRGSRNMILQV